MTFVVWGTPLDKSNDILRADMFKVVAESGASATYTGIVDKRRPTLSDFVTLHPGQTVQARVNLLKGYWFPQQGPYTISLTSYLRAFIGEVELESVIENGLENFEIYDLMSSESIVINILDITPEPSWGPIYNETLLGAVTVNANCDSTRANTIRTADTHAGTLISRVRTYLGRGCQSTGNFVTWMGVCDNTRFNTVTSNFNSINSRWGNGYRVDCAGSSCSANTYAYVFPSDSTYTVYVCGAFWNARAHNCASSALYDTQSGTIIHEISHFSNVAATSDIAYGTTNCQNLAKSNPSQAVRNADSHEYLAESCP